MTTQTTTAAAAATPAAKPQTLADNFPPREIFPTLADALARWGVITGFADAANVRPFITGLRANPDAVTEENPEGIEIDPAAYPDTHEVMIAKLTERGDTITKADGTKEPGMNRIVALVLHPIVRLETMLGIDSLPVSESVAEAREVWRKESQHRAVRPLRLLKGNYTDESAVQEAQDKMPQTVAEYISGTRSGSGLMEAFNKHALDALARFKALDGKKKAVGEAFTRAKLTKPTLRLALSNAAYAASEYARIESAGLFVLFINILADKAKAEGLSTAIYETWLNTRDEQTFDPREIDLSGDDLGDLFAESKPADESTGAAPAEQPTA